MTDPLMALGLPFEDKVAIYLRRLGLGVEPFGQGLLSRPVSAFLVGSTDSWIRNLPDLAIFIPGLSGLQFADPKTTTETWHRSGNVAIEIRSLHVASLLDAPTWYMTTITGGLGALTAQAIIDGGHVVKTCCGPANGPCWSTAQDAIQLGLARIGIPRKCPARASDRGVSSKDPYVLVRRDDFKSVDQIFQRPQTLAGRR